MDVVTVQNGDIGSLRDPELKSSPGFSVLTRKFIILVLFSVISNFLGGRRSTTEILFVSKLLRHYFVNVLFSGICRYERC